MTEEVYEAYSKHRTSHYIGSKIKFWWKLPSRQTEKLSPGTALRFGAHFSQHLTRSGGESTAQLESMRVFTADFTGARISPQGCCTAHLAVKFKVTGWCDTERFNKAEEALVALADRVLVTCFCFWHAEGNATKIAAQLSHAASADYFITDQSQIWKQHTGLQIAHYLTPMRRIKLSWSSLTPRNISLSEAWDWTASAVLSICTFAKQLPATAQNHKFSCPHTQYRAHVNPSNTARPSNHKGGLDKWLRTTCEVRGDTTQLLQQDLCRHLRPQSHDSHAPSISKPWHLPPLSTRTQGTNTTAPALSVVECLSPSAAPMGTVRFWVITNADK